MLDTLIRQDVEATPERPVEAPRFVDHGLSEQLARFAEKLAQLGSATEPLKQMLDRYGERIGTF